MISFKNLLISFFFLALIFPVSAQSGIKNEAFPVYGICGMCKETIENTVYKLRGVKEVEWNIESKILTVTYQSEKISLEEIHQSISNVGYATTKFPADSTAYKKLPYCCQVEGACSPR